MGIGMIPKPRTLVFETGRYGGVSNSLALCIPSFLNIKFLLTFPGVLKLIQAIVGGTCETLLLNYGMPYSTIIGSSFLTLMSTCIASVSTVSLLLFCYVVSYSSFRLIRSSLFEMLFNLAAAVSYCSSSCFMLIAVKVYLYPLYIITFGFVAYPAMCAAYTMGFCLALVHTLDAYQSYKAYRGIA